MHISIIKFQIKIFFSRSKAQSKWNVVKLWFAPAKFNSRISAPRNSKDGRRGRGRECYKTDEGEREETEGRRNRGRGTFSSETEQRARKGKTETGRGRRGGGEQPGSAWCAAASCENRLMMQPAAELHRVLAGDEHAPYAALLRGPRLGPLSLPPARPPP